MFFTMFFSFIKTFRKIRKISKYLILIDGATVHAILQYYQKLNQFFGIITHQRVEANEPSLTLTSTQNAKTRPLQEKKQWTKESTKYSKRF